VDGAVQILVPLVVLAMMVSMGMELTPADFARVFRFPRAALVGVVGQLIALPLLGLAFAHALGLSTALAMGVVVITACPGSAPSNVFSYLGGGNVALSVSLTAVSSVATAITIPLWVELGLSVFAAGSALPGALPLGRTFAQLLGLSVAPVAIGMALRARAPRLCARLRPQLRRTVGLLMGVALVAITYLSREALARDLPIAAPSAIALVTLALVLGYGAARVARLDPRDAYTVSIEVGLQNGALATFVVTNLLAEPAWIVFPGAYALLGFAPVAAWAAFAARRHRR